MQKGTRQPKRASSEFNSASMSMPQYGPPLLRRYPKKFCAMWSSSSSVDGLIVRKSSGIANRRLPSRRFSRRNPWPRYELDRANTGPLANAGMRRGYDLRVFTSDPGWLGQRLNIRNFVKAPLGHRSSRSAFNSLNFLR